MPGKTALFVALFILTGLAAQSKALAASCVWKITSANGHVLYLGGSFHALRPTDYPLPPQYNAAFDASSRLVFEQDPKTGAAAFKALLKAGEYPKGDSLKNHVDPRTYEYLRHFFGLRNVPEQKFDRLHAWLIDLVLTMPPPQYYQLGVEEFLEKRAAANSKPVTGLESTKEHNGIFVGLTDRQAEALLLIEFINAGREGSGGGNIFDAWHRGNVDLLAAKMRESYRDFPYIAQRLLDDRNRQWIPKIEQFLQSGQTYFVVVGAGHLGGSQGVVALLKARGYRAEQL